MKKSGMLLMIVVGFLGACASDQTQQPLPKILLDSVKTLTAAKPDTTAQRAAVQALSREQLIGTGTNPLILVDIEVSQQYATLSQVARNGDFATFQSFDLKTITFNRGLLSATRGMGADLMSLDTTDTMKILHNRTGKSSETRRTHRYLGSENHTIAVIYDCVIFDRGMKSIVSINKKFRLRRFDEDCASGSDNNSGYTNTYWQNPTTKEIWKSRQWAGPQIGYLGVEVLIQ